MNAALLMLMLGAVPAVQVDVTPNTSVAVCFTDGSDYRVMCNVDATMRWGSPMPTALPSDTFVPASVLTFARPSPPPEAGNVCVAFLSQRAGHCTVWRWASGDEAELAAARADQRANQVKQLVAAACVGVVLFFLLLWWLSTRSARRGGGGGSGGSSDGADVFLFFGDSGHDGGHCDSGGHCDGGSDGGCGGGD